MLPPINKLGRFKLETEFGNYDAECDRCAIGAGGELLLISLTAAQRRIAGIQAWINSDQKGAIRVADMEFTREGRTHPMYVDQVFRQEGGYNRMLRRLDPRYDRSHAIFYTRMPQFMPNMGDLAIKLKLNDPTICTTPFLPGWIPDLSSEMRKANMLKHAFGFQCSCGIMDAKPEDIDALVLRLGRAGRLPIEHD